jgi:hypothetical protein
LVPVSSSPSSGSYYHFAIFRLLSQLNYNHVNIQNYLKCHTSDVRNRELETLFYPISTMFQNFALPSPKMPSFECPTEISHLLFHVYLKRHRYSLVTIVSAPNVINRAIRIFNGRSGLIKYLFAVDIFTRWIKILKKVLPSS